jgi:hypothetical protein
MGLYNKTFTEHYALVSRPVESFFRHRRALRFPPPHHHHRRLRLHNYNIASRYNHKRRHFHEELSSKSAILIFPHKLCRPRPPPDTASGLSRHWYTQRDAICNFSNPPNPEPTPNKCSCRLIKCAEPQRKDSKLCVPRFSLLQHTCCFNYFFNIPTHAHTQNTAKSTKMHTKTLKNLPLHVSVPF